MSSTHTHTHRFIDHTFVVFVVGAGMQICTPSRTRATSPQVSATSAKTVGNGVA
jgi:hypothetical protein